MARSKRPFEQKWVLPVPTFSYYVNLYICEDVTVTCTRLFHNFKPCVACQVVVDLDQPFTDLFLPLDVTPDTIAHESWHAVRRMLLYCGAELDNEVVAYHLGFFVRNINRRLEKCRKLARTKRDQEKKNGKKRLRSKNHDRGHSVHEPKRAKEYRGMAATIG